MSGRRVYTLHDAHNSWDEKIADIETSTDCLCADFCIPLPLSRFVLLYFGGLGHHTAIFTCIVFHGMQPDTFFTSRTFDVSFRCLIAGYPPSSKSRHCFFLLNGPAECICFFSFVVNVKVGYLRPHILFFVQWVRRELCPCLIHGSLSSSLCHPF